MLFFWWLGELHFWGRSRWEIGSHSLWWAGWLVRRKTLLLDVVVVVVVVVVLGVVGGVVGFGVVKVM